MPIDAPDYYNDQLHSLPLNQMDRERPAEIRSLEVIQVQENTRKLVSMYLESNLQETPPGTILSIAQNIYKTPRIKEYLHDLKSKAIKNHKLDDFSQIQQLENAIVYLQSQRSIEQHAGLDFKIRGAKVIKEQLTWSDGMKDKEYITDYRMPLNYEYLGNNNYKVIIPVKRNSSSSLRGNENITINFNYDGYDLIFFKDRNKNGIFDRRESGKREFIARKQYQSKHNKHRRKSFQKIIQLGEDHITSSGVKHIQLDIVF